MKGDRKTTKPIGRGKSKTKKAQGALKVIAPKPAEEKLTIANTELAFQNEEKEKRAAELVVANRELAFQNHEKEKRADELLMANKELAFQNEEKEKRAAELAIANKELLYQNKEKERRATELVIANKKLLFQTAELAKASERYRSTLDNMLEGCQIIGLDWRYLYINAAAERNNRRPNEELLGQKYMDMWIGIEATEVFKVIRRCMEERTTHQMENEFVFPDGKIGWFELSIQPIPEGVFILSQDITERKQAEMEIVRRLQNIQALQKIDQAIAGSLDLKLTLNIALEQTKTELNVDAAAVLLCKPHTQTLVFAAGVGFRTKAIERSRLRLGEGHGGLAALERRTVSVTNLSENSDKFVRASLLADEGFLTYFGTPLIAKGFVNGVLEVFHRSPFIPNQDWLDFLEVLAGQAAIAVDSASLFTDLQHSNAELFAAYDSTIEGWSHALDLRDKETEGHTQRVTEMTMKLTRVAGMTETELVHVRRGALLHDIGKMGVPDHILLKPDKLTDEEWVAMRKHPTFAYELLLPITYLRPALDIPYCHHEKWDGTGYPRGLKGEQIPLAARLFAIVDVWDALRSERPYRQGWPEEKIINHIKSLSGIHFDPQAVDLFLNMLVELSKDQAE